MESNLRIKWPYTSALAGGGVDIFSPAVDFEDRASGNRLVRDRMDSRADLGCGMICLCVITVSVGVYLLHPPVILILIYVNVRGATLPFNSH